MTDIETWLAALPDDRRPAIDTVRRSMDAWVPTGVESGLGGGMLAWTVSRSVYPKGYHTTPAQPLPFANLASQKGHMSLYLFAVHVDDGAEWLQTEAKRRGLKLDMGKSCVRFKSLDKLPLELIGEAVRRVPLQRFIERYEAQLPPSKRA